MAVYSVEYTCTGRVHVYTAVQMGHKDDRTVYTAVYKSRGRVRAVYTARMRPCIQPCTRSCLWQWTRPVYLAVWCTRCRVHGFMHVYGLCTRLCTRPVYGVYTVV